MSYFDDQEDRRINFLSASGQPYAGIIPQPEWPKCAICKVEGHMADTPACVAARVDGSAK